MAQAMAQEVIFVQTDPAFNTVLESLKELKNQGRMVITHFQTTSLENIESNDGSDFRRFMFGGQCQHLSVLAFARTASAVLRMCMLEATGIRRGLWPNFGPKSKSRNQTKLVTTQTIVDPNFILADNKPDATRILSKYDQLYPHFLIEDKIHSVYINTQISLPSMMIIFRGINFTEVIEITTTFDATRRVQQEFSSYVHITCVVRSIAENAIDLPYTMQLRDMIGMSRPPIPIMAPYVDQMTNALGYLQI